jgi:spore coat polysaccharide biosynthesis protein SpsF
MTRLRTLAVVQARMSSGRLPGKVLAPIAGRPGILFMYERLLRARRLDGICLATSVDSSDDPLAEAARGAGMPVFRGSLDDVLDRFVGAARLHGSEIVVRLTGDCPLIDPDLVDGVVALLDEEGYDYVSNANPPTFPDGLDAEAVRMEALESAGAEASFGSEREHVTLFIRNRPERFRCGNLRSPLDLSALRWTVDYQDDLELVRQLVGGVKGDPILADRFDFLRAYDELGLGKAAHPRNEGLAASLAQDRAQDRPGTTPTD